MPTTRPTPPPFEPAALERSLNRYLAVGLVFMVVLIAGFIAYRVREPTLRRDANAQQLASYKAIGAQLFDTNCAGCHGKNAAGGSAPVLNSQEFLKNTTDAQITNLIAGGVPGTEMPAWSLAFSGTLTDEQIHQITTYLRSLEPSAPSVPTWRSGKQ
jgi:mono/diheme cytochrome c family protein